MRETTTRLGIMGAVLFTLLYLPVTTTAGELKNQLIRFAETCVNQQLILQVYVYNINSSFAIGNTKTWVDVKKNGNVIYSSQNDPDEREIGISGEAEFDYETGWYPTESGDYEVTLKSEGEFAINGVQEDTKTATICPAPSCPDRPSVSSTEIYLGSGNTGSITYSAQANCCYKIRLTIVTGRNAVTSRSPEDWVEFTGGSQSVSVTVDRASWGEQYIVGRVDYQSCDGEHRGSDYILIRDGEEQQASDPTPQPPGVTTGQTPQAGKDGDPINTALGERIGATPVTAVDNEVLGKLPVRNVRQYLSNLPAAVNTDRGYGPGWSNSFSIRGVSTDHEAYVIRGNGQVIRFRRPESNYELDWPKDRAYSFARTESGAVFADPVEHRVYAFDANGDLDAIHDGYGFTIDVTYENGLLASVKLPSGKGLTYTHREDGRITSVTDGTSTTQYGYNTAGILSSFTDANGQTTTYNYQRDWLLSSVTTAEGRTAFTTEYDAEDRVIRQDFGEGVGITFTYDGATTRMASPLGTILTHTHDAMNRLTEATDADGHAATFQYDANGNRSQITDRDGADFDRTYTNGLLSKLENPDGGIWTWTYQPRTLLGVTLYELASHTLPNGASYAYTIGSQGLPTKVTSPDGASIDYTYSDLGTVLSIKGSMYNDSYTYNADGLMMSHTDRYGTETTVTRNGWGGITDVRRGGEVIATQQFSMGHDLTSSTSPLRGSITYGRDKDGRITSETDGAGRVWVRTYDDRGRLTSADNPSGGSADFTWAGFVNMGVGFGDGQTYTMMPDLNGRLTQIQNATGATWTSSYTKEGVLSGVVLPGDAAWTFTSDAMGRPSKITAPSGAAWGFTYDQFGRRTSEVQPTGTTVQREYSQDLTTTTTRFGDLDLQFKANLSLGSLQWRIQDDLVWNTKLNDTERKVDVTSPSGTVRSTWYNEDGLPTRLQYDVDVSLLYTYDDHLPVKADYGSESHTWSYDPSKKVSSIDGNAVTRDATGRITGYDGVTYDRSPIGRVDQINLDATRWIKYSYDTRGYVNEVEDWLGGKTSVVFDAQGHLCDVTYPNGFHVSYSWSAGGMISGVTYGDQWSIDYQHNDAGQITGVTRDLGIEPTYRVNDQSMSYDNDNHLEQGSYDALDNFNGSSATPTVTYGGFGPKSIDFGGSTAEITSDAYGYPTEVKTDDLRVGIKWNLGARYQIPLEYGTDDDKTTLVSLPMGVILYGIDGKGARHHYLDDGLGNVVLETDEDNNVIGGRVYSPFGATLGMVGNPGWLGYRGAFGGLTFTGEEMDDEVSIIGGRVYYPQIGRFGTSAGLFSGQPVGDDPRYANPSVPAMDPLRYIGSGQNLVDLFDRYTSPCEIDEEDFVLPRYRLGFGTITEQPRSETSLNLSGGLSLGYLRGYRTLEPDMDQIEESDKPPVRYAPPTYAGFKLSAEWGDVDEWDVALRYAGEFGAFRLRPDDPPLKGLGDLFLRIMEDGTPPTGSAGDAPQTEPDPDSKKETPNRK